MSIWTSRSSHSIDLEASKQASQPANKCPSTPRSLILVQAFVDKQSRRMRAKLPRSRRQIGNGGKGKESSNEVEEHFQIRVSRSWLFFFLSCSKSNLFLFTWVEAMTTATSWAHDQVNKFWNNIKLFFSFQVSGFEPNDRSQRFQAFPIVCRQSRPECLATGSN